MLEVKNFIRRLRTKTFCITPEQDLKTAFDIIEQAKTPWKRFSEIELSAGVYTIGGLPLPGSLKLSDGVTLRGGGVQNTFIICDAPNENTV